MSFLDVVMSFFFILAQFKNSLTRPPSELRQKRSYLKKRLKLTPKNSIRGSEQTIKRKTKQLQFNKGAA